MWRITNERKGASPLLGFLPLFRTTTTEVTTKLGMDLDLEFLVEFTDRHVRMAAVIPDWESVGEMTVQHLERPDFLEWICSGLAREALTLNNVGDALRRSDFGQATGISLAGHIRHAVNVLEAFLTFNQFVNTADFYHDRLTKRLFSILNDCLRSHDTLTPNAAYGMLTTPEKAVWIQEEQKDALILLAALQAEVGVAPGSCNNAVHDAAHHADFERHAEKYFWIQYEQEGYAQTPDDFRHTLAEMSVAGINARLQLALLESRREKSRVDFANAWASALIPETDCQLFVAARQLVYWKLHLREIKVRFYCCLDGLLSEAATRLGLDRVAVRHLTVDELVGWLEAGFLPDVAAINQRVKYSVFHFARGIVTVFVGEDAKKAFSVVADEPTADSVTVVEGTCGQSGVAKGRVRQVLTVEDMSRFRKGEILVAYMTDIGVVPAMRRAAAIVTDVGGVTCHAAIVAREFGIPCIIGTRIGTKALRDGYLVNVNANAGAIEIVAREPFLDDDVMERSDETVWDPSSVERMRVQSPSLQTTPIRNLSAVTQRDLQDIGGKAAALSDLIRMRFPVPPGFVIPSSAFQTFVHESGLTTEINQLLAEIRDAKSLAEKSSAVRRLIINTEIQADVAANIYSAFDALNAEHVAVRSSAPMEDSAEASWAGQLDTYLNTTRVGLLTNIRQCWASRFTSRAIAYGLDVKGGGGIFTTAVVVQKMVDSRVAGTAFSVHPVLTDGRSMLIESCAGLGELVVSGREAPTTYLVDRESLSLIRQTRSQPQTYALRRAVGGVGNQLIALSNGERAIAELTAGELKELSSMVMMIEREFGVPVDVEWAFDSQQLFILQSRPITAVNNSHPL